MSYIAQKKEMCCIKDKNNDFVFYSAHCTEKGKQLNSLYIPCIIQGGKRGKVV